MYDEAFVLREMRRRAPAATNSPPRARAGQAGNSVGIYNGKTTGTPICAVIRNTNQRSNDYAELAAQPRPGHADYLHGYAALRFLQRPMRRRPFLRPTDSSVVFAGALCKLWLKEQGVTVGSHIQSIAQIQDMPFDDVEVTAEQLDALRNANIR